MKRNTSPDTTSNPKKTDTDTVDTVREKPAEPNTEAVKYGAVRGYFDFIREQGIVKLAVGFILGGAVSKLVTSMVTDLVNPFLGLILGFAGNLGDASIRIGNAEIRWGSFVNSIIDFVVIATIVYVMVKLLRLEKLDKKK